jgi:response regulator RpfG family c-di-GMP phosphodiesterase
MTVGNNLLDHLYELLTPRTKKSPAARADSESQIPEPVVPWVLCIDDDPDYSRALKLRLESHGVAVVRAYDGVAGFHSAFANSASAILLDYHLPNAQGDYVLGRLKDTAITRDIPVIVVTGMKDRAIERKMMNLGAEVVLTKPVEFVTLRRELARHINILAGAAPGFEVPVCETIV